MNDVRHKFGESNVGKRLFIPYAKQNACFSVIITYLNLLTAPAMKIVLIVLAISVLSLISCRPSAPEEIPLPTKICVLTSHHGQPIPRAKVWLKYGAETFPGYDQPNSYFDAVFETGADARGCIASVPAGKHWLIAFGYDSLHYPNHVYGSMLVEISLQNKPVMDTILYVSE